MRLWLGAFVATLALAASAAAPLPDTACTTLKTGHDSDILCGLLFHVNDPAVPLAPGAMQSFRLVYAPSFDPYVMVRIDLKADGSATLTAKDLIPYAGHDDKVHLRAGVSRTIALSRHETRDFTGLVARADFWNAPTQYHLNLDLGGDFLKRPPKGDSVLMSDGAYWFLEGMTPMRYKVMADDAGAFASPLRDIGLAMLGLAKRHVPGLHARKIY